MRDALFYKKTVDIHHGDDALKLQRRLGLWDLVALGIGSIMGTGVFVLAGKAATQAGPGVMLSFVLAALCAGLSAMCYAEMAGMLPVSGSAYLYAYATLGEAAAFGIGWVLAAMYLIGAATLGVGWSGYSVTFAQHLGLGSWPAALSQAPYLYDGTAQAWVATGAWCNVPAAAVILAVAALLHGGVPVSARLTAVMVVIKLGVVLLFIACAAPAIDPANWQPLIPANQGAFGALGPSGVFKAGMLLFFAYMGFDAVSAAAAETRNPSRNLPLGILISLAVCAALYVAAAATLTGVVPYTQLGVPYPMALGARAAGAPWLESLIDVGAIVGLSSVLLAQLYVQPRILMAMAQDRLLPPALMHVHPTRHVPHRLTWAMAAVSATAAALLPVEVLGELTSLGILGVFATVAVGVAVQRVAHPRRTRHFRVPLGPYLLPGLSVAVCVGLMACASALAMVQLGLLLMAGALFYVAYSLPRAQAYRARQAPRPPSHS